MIISASLLVLGLSRLAGRLSLACISYVAPYKRYLSLAPANGLIISTVAFSSFNGDKPPAPKSPVTESIDEIFNSSVAPIESDKGISMKNASRDRTCTIINLIKGAIFNLELNGVDLFTASEFTPEQEQDIDRRIDTLSIYKEKSYKSPETNYWAFRAKLMLAFFDRDEDRLRSLENSVSTISDRAMSFDLKRRYRLLDVESAILRYYLAQKRDDTDEQERLFVVLENCYSKAVDLYMRSKTPPSARNSSSVTIALGLASKIENILRDRLIPVCVSANDTIPKEEPPREFNLTILHAQ